MKNNDYASEILKCCKEREEVLIKGQSMRKYNKYFDKMRRYALKLIDENRQDELLPYLESDSVSVCCDIAGLLFNTYPELCTKKFQEIDNMTIETGLQKHFIIVAATANSNLEIGIPKNFP